MDTSTRKYYIDSQFRNYPENFWKDILDIAFTKADSVEFNQLFFKGKYPYELDDLQSSLIDVLEKPKRLYPGRKVFRYRITKKILGFINSKGYKDWENYFFEDISFRSNGEEFLATITHENYVIMLLTEDERSKLNSRGYNFDIEWNEKR
jgi:hypothetical protein